MTMEHQAKGFSDKQSVDSSQVELRLPWRYRCPVWLRMIISVVLVMAAWMVTFTFRESVDAPTFQTPFFVCAIVLASWIGGLGPGIVATLLSIILIEYTFTEPRFTIGFTLSEFPKFFVFFLTGLFIGLIARRQRQDELALLAAREELEERVRERTSALQKANDRLLVESKERARAERELARVSRITMMGELTASIAHEINQPLAAVVTNANAAQRWLNRDEPDLGEAGAAIQRIIRDGKRGSEVLSRIRALLKNEETERSQIQINHVIQEIFSLTRGELQGVRLEENLAEDLPSVFADRVQVQQVLLNLILNANEAMVAVPKDSRSLSITSEFKEGCILVSVRDSGPGLPESIEQLFGAFYSTKPNGLGIGLSLCRSIIENHGGRLWAENNEGPGAVFQFTLPLATEGEASS